MTFLLGTKPNRDKTSSEWNLDISENVTQLLDNYQMKLTAGELYFINERDHFTGESTNFYKIGIVRQGESRGSSQRLKEHQTGNPRTLQLSHVVKTDVVERVETLMHKMFAKNRLGISEWFRLTDLELQNAIQTAEKLSKETAEIAKIIFEADVLGRQVSNGQLVKPTDEHIEIYRQLLMHELAIKLFTGVEAKIRTHLKEKHEAGESVGGVGRAKEKTLKETFDEKRFMEENADLAVKYMALIEKVEGRFLPKRPKDVVAEIDELLNDKVKPIVNSALSTIEEVTSGRQGISVLNTPLLDVVENKATHDWQYEITQASLKVAVGNNDGIDGLATWKRQLSTKPKFDRERFKEENFDLFKTYLVLKEVGGGMELVVGQLEESES